MLVKCLEQECEYGVLNGGDGISDFYYCEFVGIAVDRGNDECLIDEFDKETK